MTDEELKNKCTERAKIFQQTMESCHSSSPIDCIEWFADRIAELTEQNTSLLTSVENLNKSVQELEKENAELKNKLEHRNCLDCSNHSSKLRMRTLDLEKENAELRKVAEFQQSSNMSRHFENKKLKEGLAVGSILNKGLNSLNKTLEEERDKYRNMVFDKDEQLTKAKEILHKVCYEFGVYNKDLMEEAKQFLSEVEK